MSTAAPPTAADLPDRDGVMAQAGAENFTVASALVGHQTQRHLRAIYGFARLVDDVGDEATGDRRRCCRSSPTSSRGSTTGYRATR